MAKIESSKLVSMLSGWIREANTNANDLAEVRKTNYKAYRAETDLYGKPPKGWATSVHPTIYDAVEWLKPGLIEIFTGEFLTLKAKRPPKGTTTEDAQKSADRVAQYIRQRLFNVLDGEELIEDFIHNSLVFHNGYVKTTQRDENTLDEETYKEIRQSAIQQMDGVVQVQAEGSAYDMETGDLVYQNATIIRKSLKDRGFCVESVHPNEIRELPGYADRAKNPFVAHVVDRSLDYIRRQEETGFYRKGAYDEVKRNLTGAQEGAAELTEERELTYTVDGLQLPNNVSAWDDRKETVGATKIPVWECYVRMRLGKDTVARPYIIHIAGDVVLKDPEINPYKAAPIDDGYYSKEPNKATGRGVSSILEQRQKVATNLLRNIQDMSAMSACGGFLTADDDSKRALQNWSPGMVAKVSRNAFQYTREFSYPTPNQFMFKGYEIQMNEIAKEIGVNENMQGLDDNTLNKTAAGMSMRLTAGMQRQKLLARRFARAFKRVIRRILSILKLFPPEDDLALIGSDIVLDPADFLMEYSVEINIGIGPQDKMMQAQHYAGLVQYLTTVGIQMGITDKGKIVAALKEQYAAQDIDISSFVLNEEEMGIVEELQGQIQGMGQAIEEMKMMIQQLMQGQGQPPRQEPPPQYVGTGTPAPPQPGATGGGLPPEAEGIPPEVLQEAFSLAAAEQQGGGTPPMG